MGMITSQLCPGLPPPPVFAGEQDVGPSERGDMREQSGVAIQPGPLPRGDGLTEVFGVPVDDDGGEQVETGHAVVLPFGGAIPDFTLSPDAQGVFQGVMGLTLVQANLGPALHVGVEEPFDDEEGPDIAARITVARTRTGSLNACAHLCVKVVIRQSVRIEDAGFVCRQVEQRRALPRGQDGAVRHRSFAFCRGFVYIWFRYILRFTWVRICKATPNSIANDRMR